MLSLPLSLFVTLPLQSLSLNFFRNRTLEHGSGAFGTARYFPGLLAARGPSHSHSQTLQLRTANQTLS
jgi:hypothetical protein